LAKVRSTAVWSLPSSEVFSSSPDPLSSALSPNLLSILTEWENREDGVRDVQVCVGQKVGHIIRGWIGGVDEGKRQLDEMAVEDTARVWQIMKGLPR